MAHRVETAEYEIGKYICPTTKSPVSLKSSEPLAVVRWPIQVEVCPDCGQPHRLEPEDVYHRPAFGYE